MAKLKKIKLLDVIVAKGVGETLRMTHQNYMIIAIESYKPLGTGLENGAKARAIIKAIRESEGKDHLLLDKDQQATVLAAVEACDWKTWVNSDCLDFGLAVKNAEEVEAEESGKKGKQE